MNFGSKYVYNYSDSEEECVSDDEYDQGMTRQLESDDEDLAEETDIVRSAATPVHPDEASSSKEKGNQKQGGIFGRLMNTISGGGSPKPGKGSTSRRTVSVEHQDTRKRKKHHHWLSSDHSPMVTDQRYGEQQQQGRMWRRADTNVINVKFDALKAPSDMHTGDPFHCTNCEAVLSKLSKLVQADDDSRNWKCEFCGTANSVDLVDEEIPSSEDTTFMLTPAPCTTASGRSGEDETLVIFCVDTSGSMCVTTEVPGKINMRGSRLERLQSLNESGESQYFPGQRRNATYVSRLQGVQAAVDHQLGEMQKEHKNRRVALVTFNSEVTIIGDGTGDPIHISGDKLGNKQELLKIGEDAGTPKPVKDSRETLGDKVFDLEEGGQTALGPALLLSISMACQVPGSKVIICTDGMANVGLGSLDGRNNGTEYEEASVFYDEVASVAAEKGVSVSVISIKGTDCKMVELGKVADATGGQVNIVDPLKLTQQFGSILADPVIATNVTATLQLHNGLYFRFEESPQSKVTRYVGNVTKQTEVTFEYGVREEYKKKRKQQNKSRVRVSTVKEETSRQMEQVYDNAGNVEGASNYVKSAAQPLTEESFDKLKELPFQLQIKYTDLDGAQALRVISRQMPVTNDRREAEKEMNMAAIGAHATKQSAALALQGDYTPSRLNAFMYQRLLHRKATSCDAPNTRKVYDNFYSNALPMENRMNQMQRAERARHGTTYSDEEVSDDEGEEMGAELRAAGEVCKKKKKFRKPTSISSRYVSAPKSVTAPVKPSTKSVSRRKECDDDSANLFYQNAQLKSDQLQ